jgi:AraC-like DNA-binding protein
MARRREAVTESAYLRRVIGDGAINPIGKAPSIGDLAEAAGMSVSHFIRAFRQSTGATPGAYRDAVLK